MTIEQIKSIPMMTFRPSAETVSALTLAISALETIAGYANPHPEGALRLSIAELQLLRANCQIAVARGTNRHDAQDNARAR